MLHKVCNCSTAFQVHSHLQIKKHSLLFRVPQFWSAYGMHYKLDTMYYNSSELISYKVVHILSGFYASL